MSKLYLFKCLLLVQTIGLFTYTLIVFEREGSDLFSVFINNILSVSWSGQFNLDFLCYLSLSGLWIMWRNKFNSKAIIVGILAMILGIIFFAPYLIFLISKENGDLKAFLIGDRQ
ncbi:hypothetical protein CHU92_03355 [Flavobacterium cyanobacteriorum]|uniref:DUF2834 domain-containing protein n=1 Tax=Flavobacterium cyanobacteriorum TaxID=2022802 RepID=A0A255ZPZ5_9FLAO|nr:hypothetical protein [Flavobacterium cyanobacteriorum]OYQ43491.1 hypothetical protein CHU92_03355 [Flavobacterium cyanobacteriorum]